MADLIGGRYQILATLGRGGMGLVYKAYDPVLDRDVAIKKMSATVGDSDEHRRRFQIEARAAARLNHPNIVTIYELEEYRGDVYIVMELLDGLPLGLLLQRRVPLSRDAQLTILAQVCDGLGFAHARAIVHRDVKPANLMLLPTGIVKILDFGIARLASSELTRQGAVLGTPNYMAPEQVIGSDVDARADLFSVGAVAYEMAAGVKAFDGNSVPSLLMKIAEATYTPLDQVAPHTPPALVALVARLLSKDRDQRPARGEDVRTALEAIGRVDDLDAVGSAVTMALSPAEGDTIVQSGPPVERSKTPIASRVASHRTPTPASVDAPSPAVPPRITENLGPASEPVTTPPALPNDAVASPASAAASGPPPVSADAGQPANVPASAPQPLVGAHAQVGAPVPVGRRAGKGTALVVLGIVAMLVFGTAGAAWMGWRYMRASFPSWIAELAGRVTGTSSSSGPSAANAGDTTAESNPASTSDAPPSTEKPAETTSSDTSSVTKDADNPTDAPTASTASGGSAVASGIDAKADDIAGTTPGETKPADVEGGKTSAENDTKPATEAVSRPPSSGDETSSTRPPRTSESRARTAAREPVTPPPADRHASREPAPPVDTIQPPPPTTSEEAPPPLPPSSGGRGSSGAKTTVDSATLSAFSKSGGSSSPSYGSDSDLTMTAASVVRVKDAVERYGRAFEAHDADTFRSLRNPIPLAEQKLFDQSASVRFSDLDVHVDGTQAIVRARRTVTVDGRGTTDAVDLHLIRRPSGWVITTITPY